MNEYLIQPLEDCEPEIGGWLWAIEDTRSRTLSSLGHPQQEILDALPPIGTNSVATLLYHIADAEASWLYTTVLEQPLPDELAELLTYEARDEQGLLTKSEAQSLEDHLHRLETVRRHLFLSYRAMTLGEFRRPRSRTGSRGTYLVTPEWVLHHLIQHEAEHRGHIQVILESMPRD